MQKRILSLFSFLLVIFHWSSTVVYSIDVGLPPGYLYKSHSKVSSALPSWMILHHGMHQGIPLSPHDLTTYFTNSSGNYIIQSHGRNSQEELILMMRNSCSAVAAAGGGGGASSLSSSSSSSSDSTSSSYFTIATLHLRLSTTKNNKNKNNNYHKDDDDDDDDDDKHNNNNNAQLISPQKRLKLFYWLKNYFGIESDKDIFVAPFFQLKSPLVYSQRIRSKFNANQCFSNDFQPHCFTIWWPLACPRDAKFSSSSSSTTTTRDNLAKLKDSNLKILIKNEIGMELDGWFVVVQQQGKKQMLKRAQFPSLQNNNDDDNSTTTTTTLKSGIFGKEEDKSTESSTTTTTTSASSATLTDLNSGTSPSPSSSSFSSASSSSSVSPSSTSRSQQQEQADHSIPSLFSTSTQQDSTSTIKTEIVSSSSDLLKSTTTTTTATTTEEEKPFLFQKEISSTNSSSSPPLSTTSMTTTLEEEKLSSSTTTTTAAAGAVELTSSTELLTSPPTDEESSTLSSTTTTTTDSSSSSSSSISPTTTTITASIPTTIIDLNHANVSVSQFSSVSLGNITTNSATLGELLTLHVVSSHLALDSLISLDNQQKIVRIRPFSLNEFNSINTTQLTANVTVCLNHSNSCVKVILVWQPPTEEHRIVNVITGSVHTMALPAEWFPWPQTPGVNDLTYKVEGATMGAVSNDGKVTIVTPYENEPKEFRVTAINSRGEWSSVRIFIKYATISKLSSYVTSPKFLLTVRNNNNNNNNNVDSKDNLANTLQMLSQLDAVPVQANLVDNSKTKLFLLNEPDILQALTKPLANIQVEFVFSSTMNESEPWCRMSLQTVNNSIHSSFLSALQPNFEIIDIKLEPFGVCIFTKTPSTLFPDISDRDIIPAFSVPSGVYFKKQLFPNINIDSSLIEKIRVEKVGTRIEATNLYVEQLKDVNKFYFMGFVHEKDNLTYSLHISGNGGSQRQVPLNISYESLNKNFTHEFESSFRVNSDQSNMITSRKLIKLIVSIHRYREPNCEKLDLCGADMVIHSCSIADDTVHLKWSSLQIQEEKDKSSTSSVVPSCSWTEMISSTKPYMSSLSEANVNFVKYLIDYAESRITSIELRFPEPIKQVSLRIFGGIPFVASITDFVNKESEDIIRAHLYDANNTLLMSQDHWIRLIYDETTKLHSLRVLLLNDSIPTTNSLPICYPLSLNLITKTSDTIVNPLEISLESFHSAQLSLGLTIQLHIRPVESSSLTADGGANLPLSQFRQRWKFVEILDHFIRPNCTSNLTSPCGWNVIIVKAYKDTKDPSEFWIEWSLRSLSSSSSIKSSTNRKRRSSSSDNNNSCPVEAVKETIRQLVGDDGNTTTNILGVNLPPTSELQKALEKEVGIVKAMIINPSGSCEKDERIINNDSRIPKKDALLPTTDNTQEGAAAGNDKQIVLLSTVLPTVLLVLLALLVAMMVACYLQRRGRRSSNKRRRKGAPVIFSEEIDEHGMPPSKPLILEFERPPQTPPICDEQIPLAHQHHSTGVGGGGGITTIANPSASGYQVPSHISVGQHPPPESTFYSGPKNKNPIV